MRPTRLCPADTGHEHDWILKRQIMSDAKAASARDLTNYSDPCAGDQTPLVPMPTFRTAEQTLHSEAHHSPACSQQRRLQEHTFPQLHRIADSY